MNNKFEVRESGIEGKGVFASSLISAGEIICQFLGEEIDIAELKRRYDSGEERIDDPFQIENTTYVDLIEPYIYFNHSCEPNAGMRLRGELFALRDIQTGEEITFDYSSTEWTDDEAWGIAWTELWRVPCACDTDSCRKEIRTFSNLPAEKQSYYLSQRALMDYIVQKLLDTK